MCDLEPCIDIYITILNIDIPDFLKTQSNYAVKGGRAFDFYVYAVNNKQMIHLTDWDIACTSQNYETMKNNFIQFLQDRHPDIEIVEHTLSFPGVKNGYQVGFKCVEKECDFIDFIQYENNDNIFIDTVTNHDINYINREYMLKDLKETYNDRSKAIVDWLQSYGIDVDENSFIGFTQQYETIKQSIIDKITNKFTNDENSTRAFYAKKKLKQTANITDFDEDLNDELAELRERYEKNLKSAINEDIPKLKELLSKFYRTKDRYNILISSGGKRKRKSIKNRQYKRKTRRH